MITKLMEPVDQVNLAIMVNTIKLDNKILNNIRLEDIKAKVLARQVRIP